MKYLITFCNVKAFLGFALYIFAIELNLENCQFSTYSSFNGHKTPAHSVGCAYMDAWVWQYL